MYCAEREWGRDKGPKLDLTVVRTYPWFIRPMVYMIKH